jgi:hypothetical protein
MGYGGWRNRENNQNGFPGGFRRMVGVYRVEW